MVARDIWNRGQRGADADSSSSKNGGGKKGGMDAGACLSTARLCYEKLSLFEEGMVWAERALETATAKNTKFLEARCWVYVGIGCLLAATTKENLEEKGKMISRAGDKFAKAATLDNQDHFVEFYQARSRLNLGSLKVLE